jgi:hypothetical protein
MGLRSTTDLDKLSSHLNAPPELRPHPHPTPPLRAGLGGFDPDPLASVDPDPGGMPNMPLSLGEEVLSLASSTERSRMAFAFGAMKGLGLPPPQQQQQPQAGRPPGDAGEGGGPGGGEGGGAAAAAGQEAAGPPIRHLSVRRLWSIMPLSVALQVRRDTAPRDPPPGHRRCSRCKVRLRGALFRPLFPPALLCCPRRRSLHHLLAAQRTRLALFDA